MPNLGVLHQLILGVMHSYNQCSVSIPAGRQKSVRCAVVGNNIAFGRSIGSTLKAYVCIAPDCSQVNGIL